MSVPGPARNTIMHNIGDPFDREGWGGLLFVDLGPSIEGVCNIQQTQYQTRACGSLPGQMVVREDAYDKADTASILCTSVPFHIPRTRHERQQDVLRSTTTTTTVPPIPLSHCKTRQSNQQISFLTSQPSWTCTRSKQEQLEMQFLIWR